MRNAPLIDDMGVANVGFLIENLGKDAGELQYLRVRSSMPNSSASIMLSTSAPQLIATNGPCRRGPTEFSGVPDGNRD
jgi:hypothetical protein